MLASSKRREEEKNVKKWKVWNLNSWCRDKPEASIRNGATSLNITMNVSPKGGIKFPIPGVST